jgi:hypothetical protein
MSFVTTQADLPVFARTGLAIICLAGRSGLLSG